MGVVPSGCSFLGPALSVDLDSISSSLPGMPAPAVSFLSLYLSGLFSLPRSKEVRTPGRADRLFVKEGLGLTEGAL
uniref:Uncharacterized protein n=1 Tax=Utricularia reniformis TaxID=192314 RepID=A0A1Y0B4K2_9LAMI|nr:hypothetical protein AEK19_MT2106 [Utricularia reniformis]ART32259.1 hypothetical protein AEK19_MT2106 [Utricularia reniformis]